MPYWWTFGFFLKPCVFSTDNEVLENSWLLHLLDRSYLYSEWTTAISLSVFCFEICFVFKQCCYICLFSMLGIFLIFKLSMTFNFLYDSYRQVDFMVLFNFIFVPSHLLHLLIGFRLNLLSIIYLIIIMLSDFLLCCLLHFSANKFSHLIFNLPFVISNCMSFSGDYP